MHPVVMRIPQWVWFALALFAGVGAALAFIVYMANGMVAGDLIGVAGREHDIAIAQHRSLVGLLSCIVLQFGVAGSLFGALDREDDHAAPIVWAVLVGLLHDELKRHSCCYYRSEDLAILPCILLPIEGPSLGRHAVHRWRDAAKRRKSVASPRCVSAH